MLHIKKVLGAKPKEHVESQLAVMFTPWGESLDPDHVLEEHPEPQFARATFCTLNGYWDCAFAANGHAPTADLAAIVACAPEPDAERFDRRILVPFSPEAPLSGIDRQLQPDELLWYRLAIDSNTLAKAGWTQGMRAIVHFQAVDYACAVRVNGTLVGTHEGGYAPFSFDITDALSDDENLLTVCVADPSEFGGHLRGKQRFDRGDIWYTAQSGIWQSVWLEAVPAAHIENIRIDADAATGILAIGANLSGAGETLRLDAYDSDGSLVCTTSETAGSSTCALAAHIANVHLWSPANPHLYRLRLTYGADVVESYCGFRTVEMRKDTNGNPRVMLNGSPLFIEGVLDQAYWSDGLMTAPADDALVYDIECMRKAGFNLMRKHIKIESARWYYHCDRLGMLVLQDMVSGGDEEIHTWQWSYKPTLFKPSWNHYRDDTQKHREELGAGNADYRAEWTAACKETIELLRNHPSIIGWSLFNEGWGQFDARNATDMARKIDPSRVIDAVSGWYDQRCGDFRSVHNYFRDIAVWHDRKRARAFFISEFGGFTHRVEGHSSLPDAYGYEPYDDRGEWRQAVRDALEEVRALRDRGLAGYIYTQVSDIEEETNGILTYDRRVNKFDSDSEII